MAGCRAASAHGLPTGWPGGGGRASAKAAPERAVSRTIFYFFNVYSTLLAHSNWIDQRSLTLYF